MTPTSYIIIRLLVGIIASAALPVVMAFIWRKRGGLAGWQQFRENRRLRHDYWRSQPWPIRTRWFLTRRLPVLVAIPALICAAFFGPFIVYGAVARAFGLL